MKFIQFNFSGKCIKAFSNRIWQIFPINIEIDWIFFSLHSTINTWTFNNNFSDFQFEFSSVTKFSNKIQINFINFCSIGRTVRKLQCFSVLGGRWEIACCHLFFGWLEIGFGFYCWLVYPSHFLPSFQSKYNKKHYIKKFIEKVSVQLPNFKI